MDDGSNNLTAGTDTAVGDSSNSARQVPPSLAAAEDTTDQLADTGAQVVVTTAGEEPREHLQDGVIETQVCRSARARHPPVRFEKECFAFVFITLFIYLFWNLEGENTVVYFCMVLCNQEVRMSTSSHSIKLCACMY